MKLGPTAALLFLVYPGIAFAQHQTVANENAACDLARMSVANFIDVKRAGPPSGWSCNAVPEETGRYFVLGLHSGVPCPEDQSCSTLIGWFGVRKDSGEVILWNMAENAPGGKLRPPRY